MKITSVKDKVHFYLKHFVYLRDSDERLIANIWDGESKDVKDKMEFLGLFVSGKLTSPESIRRCRQKLQEEHPELRGTAYQKRHEEQKKVKKELGYK